MEIPATVTSKGQITIPVEVRRSLGLHAGDRVVFRLVDSHVTLRAEHPDDDDEGAVALERVPDFFDLAGSVPIPDGVDAADWPAQRDAAWSASTRDRL